MTILNTPKPDPRPIHLTQGARTLCGRIKTHLKHTNRHASLTCKVCRRLAKEGRS